MFGPIWYSGVKEKNNSVNQKAIEKGQEFDEFFIKFSEVLSWLHACKKGKLSVDKSKNNAIKINHLFHIHLS
jgi:hypothetical protein